MNQPEKLAPTDYSFQTLNEPAEMSTSISPASVSPHPSLTAPPGAVDGSEAPRRFGDYELLSEIARGGMGVVYKARQVSLQRSVALKMILDNQLSSDTAVQRFYQEARAAASLDHPNIVPIYEVGQHDSRHYFSMALVEGTSLAHLVHETGPLAPETAVTLLAAVAEAVHYAHQKGIVHRDLKPENVLLDSQGRPRVTDFGLAKCAESDGNLTSAGQILGTPCYMAPEQAHGNHKAIGPATDIYALGGILYFLLTGWPPFTGAAVMEVLCKVINAPPTPPSEINPRVPTELEAVCLKCLEKEPAERYASAEDLVRALRPWTGAPIRAVAPRPVGRHESQEADTEALTAALPPRRFRGRLLALAALAGLGLGAGALFLLPGWLKKQPEQTEAPKESEEKEGPLVLPAPKHKDFPLKVEMIGGVEDKSGLFRLIEGQEVEFRLEVDRDAYVGIWLVDPQGIISQLFPNKYEPDNLLKAGQPRTIPSPKSRVRAVTSSGKERVWIVASTKRWSPLQGERDGPFLVFKTAKARQRWKRGLKWERREGRGQVAEHLLLYRVSLPK